MTITSKHPAFLTTSQRDARAILGTHAPLYFAEVPAGAESLIGAKVAGSTLTIDGDYVILIPLAGITTTLKVYVTATLTSMTLSSAGPDTLHLFDPLSTAIASAVVVTAGTGDGALTTATLQTLTLTGMLGEQYARLTLTAGGAPTSVVFTQADYHGI